MQYLALVVAVCLAFLTSETQADHYGQPVYVKPAHVQPGHVQPVVSAVQVGVVPVVDVPVSARVVVVGHNHQAHVFRSRFVRVGDKIVLVKVRSFGY